MSSELSNSAAEDVVTISAESPESPSDSAACQPAASDPVECCIYCGETRTLDEGPIEELNLVFEERLRFVAQNGNDSYFKIPLYEEWVQQLRLINVDLIGALQEMEDICRNKLVFMMTQNKRETVSAVKGYSVNPEKTPASTNVIEGPIISVNLEVSSNCQIENPQEDELRKELEEKQSQIEHLERLLDQRVVSLIDDTDLSSERSFKESKSKIEELRQLVDRKDKELRTQSAQIDQLRNELKMLTCKSEETDTSSQLEIDTTQSSELDCKLEHSEASNRKFLKQIKAHQDEYVRLEKRLQDCEQMLRKSNSAVQRRDKTIDSLKRDNGILKKIVEGSRLFMEKHESGGDASSVTSGKETDAASSVDLKLKRRSRRKEDIGDH